MANVFLIGGGAGHVNVLSIDLCPTSEDFARAPKEERDKWNLLFADADRLSRAVGLTK